MIVTDEIYLKQAIEEKQRGANGARDAEGTSAIRLVFDEKLKKSGDFPIFRKRVRVTEGLPSFKNCRKGRSKDFLPADRCTFGIQTHRTDSDSAEQMATPSSSFRRSTAQDELRDITQSLQSLPLSVVLDGFSFVSPCLQSLPES